MYDMYPEWGPSRHYGENPYDTDHEAERQAVQFGMDMRDNGGQRPDDN
jgi:hypothetical protein